MSENKIKTFPERKSAKETKPKIRAAKNKVSEIKKFLGFEYVELKKDVNGINFNEKTLEDFAMNLKYVISVMKTTDNKVSLYEYFVPASELERFLNAYHDGNISGKIIQIEKHLPDNPA